MIVEGCGSISRGSAPLANLSIWVDAGPENRRARLRKRDGGVFDAFWGVWQAQEDDFFAQEKSASLADFAISNP